jgi:uncharacterized protein with gpF-like domain
MDDLDDAEDSLGEAERTLLTWIGNDAIHSVVSDMGERIRAGSDASWRREVSSALGETVAMDTALTREMTQLWIAENTARIEGLRDETIRRMRDDIETAILSQANPDTLATKWVRDGLPTRNGNLRGRANVIARDQLGKLAGQIAEQQQRALGLTEYMWDDRPAVPRNQRAVHRGRRGARYKWDAAPPGGHPGHAILCGCRAVATVPLARLRAVFT